MSAATLSRCSQRTRWPAPGYTRSWESGIAPIASNLAEILHAQGRTEEACSLKTRSARALAPVALPHQRPEVWLIADWRAPRVR